MIFLCLDNNPNPSSMHKDIRLADVYLRTSVRFAALGSHDATAHDQNVVFASS